MFPPEIHPLILAKVRVIDLSLSLDEIQGLMLTELLQSQCKPLLVQHLQFCNDKQFLADQVVSKEVTNPFVSYSFVSIKEKKDDLVSNVII